MATITAHLRKGKCHDGVCPIYIRISHKGKECFIALGFKAQERDWNPRTGRLRKSYVGFYEANQRIEQVLKRAEDAARSLTLSGIPFTALDIKRRALGEDEPSAVVTFLAFALERHSAVVRFQTRRNHKTSLLAFEAFLRDQGASDVVFEHVTPQLLTRFKTYLQATRNIQPSTIHKYLRVLRKYYRDAMREGLVAPGAPYPFEGIMPKRQVSIKEALSREEVERFRRLDPRPGTLKYHAWNAFLLALFARGMRFEDVARLSRRCATGGPNGEVFTYTMDKTGETVQFRLSDPLREVLLRYENRPAGYETVFPFLDKVKGATLARIERRISSANAKVNEHLKTLATEASIPIKLTTHIARHTFARLLYERTKDILKVQRALKHRSITTTRQYLGSIRGVVLDDDIEEIF